MIGWWISLESDTQWAISGGILIALAIVLAMYLRSAPVIEQDAHANVDMAGWDPRKR